MQSAATNVWAVSPSIRLIQAYFSAGLLALVAVVLLVVGAPAKAASAGAGFALVGAAVTRGIDVANERKRMRTQALADRRRDVDETRRLAYAALVGGNSDPVLLGSLLNALIHHGHMVVPRQAFEHLMSLDKGEGRKWVLDQIERLTYELTLDQDTEDGGGYFGLDQV
jgi:hypothetical protein